MQTNDEGSGGFGLPSPVRLRTVREVAREILHVSESTVYELVYRGELRAKKVIGQWRISDRAIADYLGETHEADR